MQKLHRIGSCACRRGDVKFDDPHRGLKGAQDDWDHLNEAFK